MLNRLLGYFFYVVALAPLTLVPFGLECGSRQDELHVKARGDTGTQKHYSKNEQPFILGGKKNNCTAQTQPSSEPPYCEFVRKTKHDPVAFATLLLAYIVWLQLIWLVRQEWWTRRHERPYVQAGPGDRELVWDTYKLNATGMRVRLQMTNHGRTVAFVDDIYFHVRPLAGLPEEPEYSNPTPGAMLLYPQMRFESRVVQQYSFEWKDDHVAYGLITYKDAFGVRHSSGFLDKIVRKGDNFIHPTMGEKKYKKYWQND